jgi:tRNA (guanine-N7-)-methyltransferase
MARGRHLGRLKLRPLAPELEAKYLLEWHPRQLALEPSSFPLLTAQALFGSARPLEVEIGAGSGEYLCSLAAEQPEHNFLAIEISKRAVHQAVLNAAKAELGNLKVLRADFKLLAARLAPAAWLRAYLHFPDPQHRPSDAKRILFDQAFLDGMARVLQPGGKLSVVSDEPAFFAQMLELAEGDGRFEKGHAARYLEGFEPAVKSRFQRVWERKGRKPRQFVIRRK